MKTTFLKHGLLFLVSVAYLSQSFAQKEPKKNSSSSSSMSGNSSLNINENRSANTGETNINYKKGSDRYTIKMIDDKVTALYVNDKQVPADSFYVYKAVIDEIREQVKKDRAQAEEDRRQAEKDRAQANLDRQQAEKDRAQAMKDREQALKDRQQAEKDRENSRQGQAQALEDRRQAERDREQAEKDRRQAVKDRAQAVEDRKQAEVDRKQAEEDRALVKSLVDDLVKEHIVPDEKSITSLVLSDEELTINGKKQQADVHNKYKAKYLKKAGRNISFGYTSGDSNIRVSNR